MKKEIKFQKTIVCDFDGTITSRDTKSVFDIPEPREGAVRVIQKWKSEGYIVIINTLRGHGDWEIAALDYLTRHNIPYTYFNQNSKERIECYGDVRKIAGDIIIDDRNLGGIPDSFDDIDKFVKSQIGYPYKEIGGKLVEDKPNDDLSNAQRFSTMYADTGYKARFSDEFNDDVNKCPLTNVVFNNLMSGSMDEYQIIEYLLGEVKSAHNQLQQSMITFANAIPKNKKN